jgi:hypothetical protein
MHGYMRTKGPQSFPSLLEADSEEQEESPAVGSLRSVDQAPSSTLGNHEALESNSGSPGTGLLGSDS